MLRHYETSCATLDNAILGLVVVEVEEGDEEKGGGCRWRRSIYTGLFPRWKVRRGDIVLRAEEEETSTANQSPSDGR